MKAAVSPGAPPKSSIIHLEKLPNSLADYTSDMHGHLEAIRLCEEASAFLARPAQAPWAVLQAQLKLLRAQLVSVYGMYLASGYSRGFMESLAPFVGFMPIADNPGGAILMNDTACKQQAGWGLQQVVRVTCAGFLYLNQDHAVARTNLEAVAGWLANDENRRGLAPELEGFAVSLTPNELHWVVLNLLYKLLVLMMPQASKSQAAREALLDAQRQAGFKMVKALPHKADGYWRAGTPCFNQVNARLALSYYLKGIEAADEEGDAFYSCTLRYEAAWAIISGGEGPTFTLQRVQPLIQEADKLYPLIKYLPVAHRMSTEHVRKTVASLLDSYPKGRPPTTRFPCSELSCNKESIAANAAAHARKVKCSQCGTVADELKRCSACMTAGYCSIACQKAAWPTHKAECKELAKARKAQKTRTSA